jgi:glycosyltransferase involved in cell wall biosynthesis
MNKVKKLLIISPFSTHNSEFHFQNLIPILEKFEITCKIIDSQQHISKFFDIGKYKKRKEFSKLLKEYDPNFIILDGHNELVYPIIQKKIPFLFLVRGHLWKEEEWSRKTINTSFRQKLAIKRKHKIMEKCFNEASVIIPISNFLKNIVQKHFPDKKIKVIHIDAREPNLWVNKKGMELRHPCVGLLQGAGIWGKTKEMEILPKIVEKMPQVNFYWAGDGIYKKKILPQLVNFKNFKWLGNLEYPNKVKEFLTEIDVYAMFSGMDGLGQSIIEASLMKKPVVASNVGGIPETLQDGKTGFLVNVGDIEGWIENISKILKNHELAKEMGDNGRKFVSQKFNWEKIASQFIDILKREKLFNP